jgi:hypothetical protein
MCENRTRGSIYFKRNRDLRYESLGVLWSSDSGKSNLLNSLLRRGCKWGSFLRSIQLALLVSLSFVLSSCSTTTTINHGGTQIETSVTTDAENNIAVLCGSQAVDSNMFRAIVHIYNSDQGYTRVYEHRYLLVKSIYGTRYLYNKEGSILVERHFVDANGNIDFKKFGEADNFGEKFMYVEVEKVPQEKTRSEFAGWIVLPGQPNAQRTRGIPGFCTIQALNHQAELAKMYGDRVTWNSLLHVRYDKEGKETGHTYCAYYLKNKTDDGQTLYVFDEMGERKVKDTDGSAFAVGEKLKSFLVHAEYVQ